MRYPTPEEIFEEFKVAPEAIRHFVLSDKLKEAVIELAEKHDLRIDDTGNLHNEILLTLIGREKASALYDNLRKRLGLKEDIAKELASDINKEVFEKIRRLMREGSNKVKEEQGADSQTEVREEKTLGKIVEKSGSNEKRIENDNTLKREDILREIESAGEPQIEKDEDKSFLRDNVSAPETPSPNTPKAPSPDTRNIMDKKLSESSVSKKEDDKKRPNAGIDPYREPIEE